MDTRALVVGRAGAKRVSGRSIRARLGIRRASLVLAAVALALALAAMSVGVVLSRDASKAQILTNLKARGMSSAGFVSAFIAQQAAREREAGGRLRADREASGSVLSIFVEHASTLKPHHVLLVDADGRIIASSPSTRAATLGEVNRGLAQASTGASIGHVTIAGMRSTFVVSPVPGTPWRLVMASPDSRLFASIGGWAKWLPWIVVALVAILGLVVLGLLLRSNAERVRLAALSRKLAEAASTDALTGLANRRSLQGRLTQASAFASRYEEPLSVLMIDLDHFKQINDSYGHEAGDVVLVAVADAMRQVFRDSDIYGRWGGDEFLAVLPNTDAEGALDAGQRLCDHVREIDIAEYDLLEPITLSVGCTAAVGGAPNDLISQADNSLFEAKRAGRSRVSVA